MIGSFASIGEILDAHWREGREQAHQNWQRHFNLTCELISVRVVHDIQVKFREAFPNRWYVFLVQRPTDVRDRVPPWPVMLRSYERAERYEHRVSGVVQVQF